MREPTLRRVLAGFAVAATVAAGLVAATGTAAQAADRPSGAGNDTITKALDVGPASVGPYPTALSSQQLAMRDLFAKQTGRSTAALSGPWHFINRHSDKCLTVSGASVANNAGAVQYTCDYSAPHNEDWYFEDVYGTGNWWHVINAHSGKCLTISGASGANNAGAVQYTCEYNSPYNEEWYVYDVYGTGIYWHPINRNSGKCLTVSGASVANNASAVQYTCDYSLPFNEEWAIAY
ncbi:hypothetical protein Rhe02_63330 [Rhizocola hellebori]|uniref:Ricin B lectin domain-containing protein n=1 Tax=Rhizocola hellebori TaxID=1392758 RepID=A0A8J3QCU0_9ACTN|nr:RICIN domain-containing protein [Rhizocola hellebori]GIH08266.1 hypothetical protein Rhe02_63330 [Rhizocola hellebori]